MFAYPWMPMVRWAPLIRAIGVRGAGGEMSMKSTPTTDQPRSERKSPAACESGAFDHEADQSDRSGVEPAPRKLRYFKNSWTCA